MLPALRANIEKHQNPEIIYLNVKFLWKSVHYDIDDEIKKLTLDWMPLLLNLVGMTNDTYDKNQKIIDFQTKNTP